MHNTLVKEPQDSLLWLLQDGLSQLSKKYGKYLQQEQVMNEVQLITDSLEDYSNGSPYAATYLQEHGHDILEHIERKLEASLWEQEKLREENPLAARFAPKGDAHHISRAAALTQDVQDKLMLFINSLPNERRTPCY